MVTFADLMALMMTFFVLLYSFSSIDEAKYHSVVDSMAMGFGAQWIKRGETRPGDTGTEAGVISIPIELPGFIRQRFSADETSENKTTGDTDKQQSSLARKMAFEMSDEINNGVISIDSTHNGLIIRLPEKAAFPSGSAEINSAFLPVLQRIANILEAGDEQIEVAGHTDDRPILNQKFKSNWELSSARAVSMVHLILKNTSIDKQRITAAGHADTRPLQANTSDEARSKNRRVEIIVLRNKSAAKGNE